MVVEKGHEPFNIREAVPVGMYIHALAHACGTLVHGGAERPLVDTVDGTCCQDTTGTSLAHAYKSGRAGQETACHLPRKQRAGPGRVEGAPM
jgi:hypothetical protein